LPAAGGFFLFTPTKFQSLYIMATKTVSDLQCAGKKVLVRVDFNVPLQSGEITDDTRIVAALPTIQHLVDAGAKVILMSHLGRPKGEVKAEFSLAVVAKALGEKLGKPVAFASNCVGPEAEAAVAELKDGDVLLLENVRFHKGETDNDPEFAKPSLPSGMPTSMMLSALPTAPMRARKA
jgi:phosphoglycerate kinase